MKSPSVPDHDSPGAVYDGGVYVKSPPVPDHDSPGAVYDGGIYVKSPPVPDHDSKMQWSSSLNKRQGHSCSPFDIYLYIIYNCSFEGPHKLQDKWSDDIFVVKEQPDSGTPVFVVEPVNGGRKRTLLRNLLLPV